MYSFKNTSTILALGFVVMTPVYAAQSAIDDGLVAHYEFEQDAEDRLGNHDGVIQGDPEFIVGPNGWAIFFDGDADYVSVPNSPDFSPGTDNFSVSAWFRFPSEYIPQHGDQFKNQILMIQHSQEHPHWVQLAGWGDNNDPWTPAVNTVEFGMKSGSDPAQAEARHNFSSYWDDTWHHVAGVRVNIHTLELYIDGELKEIVTNPILYSVQTYSARPMFIGYDPNYGGWFMVGGVDDLRIYRRALTPSEIKELAHISPQNLIEDLIIYIESLQLHSGITKALKAKLKSALNAIEAGDAQAAKDSLSDFIRHTSAQSGKKISQEEALQLIARAEEIIDLLL